MIRNPGVLPGMARGKRINVVLVNGMRGTNWAADGKPPVTRWSLTGSQFDIAKFEVAK